MTTEIAWPQKIAAGRVELEDAQEFFSQLYEQYCERVYRYVVLRVGNSFDAEELVAETFLRAWKGLPSYQPRGAPVAAWLFRIAHNLVVDHLRRASRRPTAPLADDEPTPGGNSEYEATIRLTFDELKRAITRLTEPQRQVIGLRFGAGLSLVEVARAMGRSQSAVKSLQHGALVALRRAIG